MPDNNLTLEHKKGRLSATKLAEKRTLMAADRTLLAWVRTAMSFISFGFTLAKVLDSLAGTLKTKLVASEGDHVGLFLIVMGTAPLIFAMYQYYRNIEMITGTNEGILTRPSFILAFFILMLSIVLFLNIFINLQIP